jgi:hypothetical protein
MRYPTRSMRLGLPLVAAIAIGGGFGGNEAAGQQGGLPFSSTYRRPAVSPYQQLSNFGNNPQAAPNVYQQMVMPLQQQQQQQIQQLQQGRQLSKLQNQVVQIQRDTTSRQVDELIRPTGHRATYMNYSHYYQPPR